MRKEGPKRRERKTTRGGSNRSQGRKLRTLTDRKRGTRRDKRKVEEEEEENDDDNYSDNDDDGLEGVSRQQETGE
ncbi:hypothetical protein E2C01_084107 [Portunus trituberculatus]|uniref:Uncharacterized protein n=1 Tax=Portunus trituberculatus TaxID=210409 RepID=A0A5B7IZ21_PORTR|nr:hypothetical protein [Portunus trituberculatus]